MVFHTTKSIQCLQVFLGLQTVSPLVSLYNLDQLLEGLLVPGDVSVDSRHKSKSSLTSIVKRGQVLQGVLHSVVFWP